jgi:uncharacterized protein YdhG (YjbR/CyaY superfamily)
MAERTSRKSAGPRAEAGGTAGGGEAAGFSADERAAMRERAVELKRASRRSSGSARADGESDLLAKIAEMPDADRVMAERLHALVSSSAPNLVPRTWYGMPAYAKDGNVVCFFRSAHKFKTRYATLGFSDKAKLDDGSMWPTDFALTALGPNEEARIRALLTKALG